MVMTTVKDPRTEFGAVGTHRSNPVSIKLASDTNKREPVNTQLDTPVILETRGLTISYNGN